MKLILPVFFFPLFLLAQPGPTPYELRQQGFAQRKSLQENSILGALKAESIGPSIFSCRVTDVDANPADPSEMFVAYASGGLWYSHSNGAAFEPLFDKEAAMTIGDIAADWQHRIIWVGTGENNSSRSSYAGTGLYRSADMGKTWQWRGLPESHHIGRIVLHPTDSNTLWVAVLGHLYSPNQERGVFKTTDGGQNWTKTLYIDDQTGAIDLVIDPNNSNILYAATWSRDRKAWNFSGAGVGSGIWKSADGGQNWEKCNIPTSGFPSGDKVGRIGLTAGNLDGKTILYACVDNQNPMAEKNEPIKDEPTKEQLRTMNAEKFAALDDEKLADFLKKNNFPEKYSAKKIKEMVSKGKITPLTLVEFLEDANNNLFETNFTGAEVYRSDDGGKNWVRTHTEALESINFTYGYYFSNIRCLPDNPDELYLLGFFIIHSSDGGKTWENINGDNVHVDHHALWLNPARPGHLINGNDGGLNISYDNGKSWFLCNNPPVGQFYAVTVDAAEPYNVYGGAQDNGVWKGPSDYSAGTKWHQTGRYPYKELLGGDGMQIAIDPRDNQTVYTGFQFGNYYRIHAETGQYKNITPKHDLGERPYRFNWQTPIHLSKHNSDVLYLGANKLFRSLDRGENWEAISPDLSGGGQKGNVPYGTLSAIHESPLKFGLLYAGSDDGLIHVSKDGGENWTNISAGLPERLWVSRVQASAHQRARVFASLNGYRWDDFSAYIYMSDDFGAHWTRIGRDLPLEPVNVIREDPANANILYVGTDHGLYVSVDAGLHFYAVAEGLPDAPVHDLAIQAKAAELIIGTHGRSLYKLDIKALQALTPEVLAADITVFTIQKTRFSKNWGKKQAWKEPKNPELPVHFFSAESGQAQWRVYGKDDLLLNSGNISCRKGLNRHIFALDVAVEHLKKYQKSLAESKKDDKKQQTITPSDLGKYHLQKGVYRFEIEKNGVKSSETFTID